MKRIALLLLLCYYQTGWSQDAFEDAIMALGTEMQYASETGQVYSFSDKPDSGLINAFRQCSGFEGMDGLGDLEFDTIQQVKSVALSKRNSTDRIAFKEWTFASAEKVAAFATKLNTPSPSYVQFCVSKGGMMWWPLNDKLYLITSSSFSTTFRFAKIKEVINRSLLAEPDNHN